MRGAREGSLSGAPLRRAGVLLGYGAVGVVGTALVGLVVLNLGEPVQGVVYDAFYLRVGPSEATETAILAHFLLAAIVALGIVMAVGDALSDRGANLPALGKGFAAMLVVLLAFLVVALTGLAAFLTALLVLAVCLVGVPLLLWYRYDVRSGALPAFVGGIPVVVVLLFLAGFGLGWGWGYVMIAEEVPASSVDDADADFGDVPGIHDDLVASDCETTSDGNQRCRLQLRGYEHETRAAQFMDRHGVRCPYQNAASGDADAFIAEGDGTYYRVTCSPHGD